MLDALLRGLEGDVEDILLDVRQPQGKPTQRGFSVDFLRRVHGYITAAFRAD